MKILESESEKQLIDESIQRFGINTAADQTIERCADLIGTLHRYPRNESSMQDVARCLASVQIGLAHLQRFIGEEALRTGMNHQLGQLRRRLQQMELADKLEEERNE